MMVKPASRRERKKRIKQDLPSRDQDRIMESLLETAKVLDNLNINWYLGHGAVLGALRNGDLLPYDRDIDIIMLADNLDTNAIISAFKSNDKFKGTYSRNDGHFRIIFHNPLKSPFNLINCLYFYRRYNDDFVTAKVKPVLSEEGIFILPSLLFKKKTYVTIRGHNFPTFTPVEMYLEWLYGEHWEIPDRRYGFRNFSARRFRCVNKAREDLLNIKRKYGIK